MIGLAVVVAAILVLGGLFAWTRFGSNESTETAAEGPAATSSTALPTTDSTAGSVSDRGAAAEQEADDVIPDSETPAFSNAPCPGDVPEEVCRAAAFVENFRGKPFKEFPTVELVTDDDFGERILRDFEDARDELDITTEMWRSLGFIDPAVNLADALATSYEVGVVGVYFTDTKELYVQGTELNLYAELVIVHELAHAHDDQWLNLDRPEFEEVDDEVGYGFSAVVEGNASRVEAAWRAGLSAGQQEELGALELGLLSPEDIEVYLSLPRLLLLFQISPYQDGEVFIEAVAARGGEDAVNEAFANPPRTSEQVLHPELYAAGHQLIEVAPPPAEGDIIDEGLVGELAFDLWFSDQAGDGWGGDYYVSWRTDSGACTRIDVVGDTELDTDELFDAADLWAREAQGRSVERVDGLVRITGCY